MAIVMTKEIKQAGKFEKARKWARKNFPDQHNDEVFSNGLKMVGWLSFETDNDNDLTTIKTSLKKFGIDFEVEE